MHSVRAEHAIEIVRARSLRPDRSPRDRGGKPVLGILGRDKAADLAPRIGEGGLDGVQPEQPDGAGVAAPRRGGPPAMPRRLAGPLTQGSRKSLLCPCSWGHCHTAFAPLFQLTSGGTLPITGPLPCRSMKRGAISFAFRRERPWPGARLQALEERPAPRGACRRNPGLRSGGVPEWLKGTDCKSVGFAYAGSNPAPSTSPAPCAAERALLRRNGLSRFP